MIRCRIQNFQSLEDVEIEIDGFTAITGQNNTGKSAVVRSIAGTFQNASGDSFIRHGTTEAKVELDFCDGTTLVWGRNKKPFYSINGAPLIYPGRGVPDELSTFKVNPVDLGGQEVWPNIGKQFKGQIFLLDLPGSLLAEAISDPNSISVLNGGLRGSETDKREAASNLKNKISERNEYNALALKFSNWNSIEESLKCLETENTRLEDNKDVNDTLSRLSIRHNHTLATVKSLSGSDKIELSAPVPHLRDIVSTEGYKVRRLKFSNLVSALYNAPSGFNLTEPSLKKLFATSKVIEVRKTLSNRVWLLTDCYNRVGLLASTLKSQFETLKELNRLSALRTQYLIRSNMNPPTLEPKPIDLLNLVEFLQIKLKRDKSNTFVTGLESQKTQIELECSVADLEYETVWSQFPTCPTCGKDTNHDHSSVAN